MKRRHWVALIVVLLAVYPGQGAIHKLILDGPIDPVRAEYLIEGIHSAEKEGAEGVLILLSTPGGLLLSMSEIMETMLGSRVPIIAFVYPTGTHAASAGFFLLMSADIAAMAPATRTGSAHPILSFGGVPMSEEGTAKTLLDKVTNDSVASLRSIVERRGRSFEMAEKAIRNSESFTEVEALKGRLIDMVAQNEADLLDRLDGRKLELFSKKEVVLKTRGVPLITVEMSSRQKFLAAISNPNLALLLGIGGILLLVFEFSNPGFIAPGVVGGICLLISLLGFSFLPINYIGVLLILLALGLLIAEIKVQSFGVLGIGGIVCMVIGCLILVRTEDPVMQITTTTAVSVGIAFGVAFMVLLYLFLQSTKFRVTTGKEGLIGMEGKVITELSPVGKVFVHGEYWDAEADHRIEAGRRIKVVRVDALRLRVKETDG